MNKIKLTLIAIVLIINCSAQKNAKMKIPYLKSDFETTLDGRKTILISLQNSNGIFVTLTNYGAKIVSVYVPAKDGNYADVVLGFKSIEEYRKFSASHGAVVGPFANRIANAQFTIDGITYNLPVNNGKNCLHSGPESWYRKVWDYSQNGNSVVFTLKTADGDFGFPGNKNSKVSYTLTDENELKIEYEITTDKTCHINVTNHAYFNLKGEGSGDVLNHRVVINADKFTPVDVEMIPTGELAIVKNTDLDFLTEHTIGERITSDHPLIKQVSGYDFNYVINKKEGELAFAASAYEPESGRFMEVFTTEPGVQLFTANSMKGVEIGKGGNPYNKYGGFCLETQHFPDSPNKPGFPSTLLKAGETYRSVTIYKFSVK